tara:strand:- start:767 stop:1237 length:471 start_codon:yes stop_codon:yes gene_type:complete
MRREDLVMENRRSKAAKAEPGPDVQEVIQGSEEPRRGLMTLLRDLALPLPGVEERNLYDGFCRHWAPAYYLNDRQLCHIHNFRAGLRASKFVGVTTLEPIILDSDLVPAEVRNLLAQTSPGRGTKQFKLSIESKEDVQAFHNLVLVKWEFEKARLA